MAAPRPLLAALVLLLCAAWSAAQGGGAPAPESEELNFSTCIVNGELCTGYPLSLGEGPLGTGVCNCALRNLLGHCDCFVSLAEIVHGSSVQCWRPCGWQSVHTQCVAARLAALIGAAHSKVSPCRTCTPAGMRSADLPLPRGEPCIRGSSLGACRLHLQLHSCLHFKWSPAARLPLAGCCCPTRRAIKQKLACPLLVHLALLGVRLCHRPRRRLRPLRQALGAGVRGRRQGALMPRRRACAGGMQG